MEKPSLVAILLTTSVSKCLRNKMNPISEVIAFIPGNKQNKIGFVCFYFKFLEDRSPSCGATDTPGLDFW